MARSKKTIRDFCAELILKQARPRSRITDDSILTQVRRRYPKARTSLGSLVNYRTELRKEGHAVRDRRLPA